MLEALARCGDKKYSGILQMSFAARVRSMVQNVLGQATEMEVITEAVASEANDGAADFDEKVKEAQRKNWVVCWKNMSFKDLHGFPLWETQLHDVLQAAFPELQSIFLHYCGSSVSGSESIGNATKVGLMEMLTIAKDTDLCTKEFKVDELTRHFTTANAQVAIATSGSADRNKMGGARAMGTGAGASPAKPTTSRQAKKDATADMQLNLFEFINLLVRVAFWRANPQWGSKYNKKDLTPVPESTQILLEECILPKAKRDTSGEFKKVLAGDQSTQAVLAEYREKLQNWLRPILRKERTIQNPNPQMTYKMWVALMDGPDPDVRESGKKPPCPKMVGEWMVRQESQITGDERTSRKNQITFKAALSIPQCRWNFLRSQTIEQVEAGDVDSEQVPQIARAVALASASAACIAARPAGMPSCSVMILTRQNCCMHSSPSLAVRQRNARLHGAWRVHRSLRGQHVRAPHEDVLAFARPEGHVDGRRDTLVPAQPAV